jgi:protein tyrosine/serine phosphatase
MKKTLKYLFFTLLLIILGVLFIIEIMGNFYNVSSNVYRSGQLNKYNLKYYIQKHSIKTIINLRGYCNNNEDYNNEINLSKQFNINHIDYEISNKKVLDYNATSKIVEILKNTKKPLLIHCLGGADRTSLVSALYMYAIENKSIDESKKAFSLFYGHTPFLRKKVIAMDKSFDIYVRENEKN